MSVQTDPLRVAVLCGSDFSSTIAWDHTNPAELRGNNDCWRLIDTGSMHVGRFHITPSYFRTEFRWNLGRYHVVLNMISDPDQNPKTIEIAERITKHLANHVINRPKHIPGTTRSEIARRLAGVPQLVVPKVILLQKGTIPRLAALINEESFRFPAILRRTGTHSGEIVGLFNRLEDLDERIHDSQDRYFLTEFVDFASPDGLYRKMRLFFIGQEVFFKHLLISDKWNVHSRDRGALMAEREELRREEQYLLEGGFELLRGHLDESLREIRRRIQLDYFGLDCATTSDGRLVLFEVNATMNFFPLPEDPRFAYLRACIEPAKAAMSRLLRSRARTVSCRQPRRARRRVLG